MPSGPSHQAPAEGGTPAASPGRVGDRVPVLARLFVVAYLAAFLACGALAIEAWPLTGWRLFSHLRHARRYGWQVTTVDRRGHPTRVNFARFPRADRHLTLIMRDYGSLPEGRQEGVCQAWAAQVRSQGRQVAGVRIYRTVVDLHRHRFRRRPPPPRRHLAYLCADGKGARAVAR